MLYYRNIVLEKLVYLSPVPWDSFAQRPHKFVEYFHSGTGGDVLWIDPYPTRFPLLSDFHRFTSQKSDINQLTPSWIKVIRPAALPVDPLPGSGFLNALMWRGVLKEIDSLACQSPIKLVIGKPSVLALSVLKMLNNIESIYDAMDDFPSFYSGFSRLAMNLREEKLAREVTYMMASSTALMQRWRNVRKDVLLVRNGVDVSILPEYRKSISDGEKRVIGYVGTIGPWFDWDWVIALAKVRPRDTVKLIGPLYTPPPPLIPENIELLPPCDHRTALQFMKGFDIGLIPFKINRLTSSVDPIKFYEYHALGLPVISTRFGEMIFHAKEEGVYISQNLHGINELVQQALLYCVDNNAIQQFTINNAWEARFAVTEAF